MHRQPGDRTGFCQPDLDRIPHSGYGTVRDQGAGRLIDLLQIVVSIVFTRFMALFQHTITCQSVLLPARNTEQSEKWRTVGVGQLLSDRFLQSLQRFYLYKKSSVSSAAWQKRCSFSNADFALDLTVRSCRTCQNHPHHGCARCGPGPAGGRWDHAGRWQIRAPARWTGGHSRGRHCGCHRGYHAGDGCCCRGNHRRGGYRCGGRGCR